LSSSFNSALISNQDDSIDAVNHFIKKNVSEDSIKLLFDKIFENSVHKEQIVMFTSIVQAIELGSMQSLIWNDVGDGKSESPYNGSPLDFLPCPPSMLLYTYDYYGVDKSTKKFIKNELEKAELCIKRRSFAVENKWTTTKLKLASIGIMQTKTLSLLDILDKHCYDLNDVSDTIETLYNKIFPKIDLHINQKYDIYKKSISNKNNIDLTDEDISKNLQDQKEINSPLTDREIIYLLCDWATTTKRCGLHRIYYIVFLIKKRQIDIINQFKEANDNIKNVSIF
jgi:mediator of RNA polymerase II transcription subunit 12